MLTRTGFSGVHQPLTSPISNLIRPPVETSWGPGLRKYLQSNFEHGCAAVAKIFRNNSN